MSKLWCLAILFMTLVSCKKEDVIKEEIKDPEPWNCLPCGEYSGTYSGNLSSSINPSLDTTIVNAPTTITISENPDSTIRLKFDLSSLLNAQPATLEVIISEAFWSDFYISGSVEPPAQQVSTLFQLEATCSSKYDSLMGDVILSGGAQGNLTFNVSQ